MNFSFLLNIICCLSVCDNLSMWRQLPVEIMEKSHIFDKNVVLLHAVMQDLARIICGCPVLQWRVYRSSSGELFCRLEAHWNTKMVYFFFSFSNRLRTFYQVPVREKKYAKVKGKLKPVSRLRSRSTPEQSLYFLWCQEKDEKIDPWIIFTVHIYSQ